VNSNTSRLPLAALIVGLAGVSLAACSGGGNGSNAPAAPNGTGPGSTTQSTGAHVTLSYTKAPVRSGKFPGFAQRHRAGTRAPKFIDGSNVGGLQLTIASGTATPQVLFFDITSANANCVASGADSITCTLNIPTLGATETISALEVDTQPIGVSPTTGLGTSFPSSSRIIAVGSTTVTLSGGFTNVPLSLNPVIASYYDCGFTNLSSANLGEDFGGTLPTAGARVVVTVGTPVTAQFLPADATIDGAIPAPVSTPGAGFVGQPFVDVDGTPRSVTVTSSSTHFAFFVEPGAAATPAPTYTTSASITNSSVNYMNFFAMIFAVRYDGIGTSPMTLTLTNNLSATPPAFGGGTPAPAYTATISYPIVPISLTPATLTFASSAAPAQTVTASDIGSSNDMTIPATSSPCVSSGSVTIATVASAGPLSNGLQSFMVTPVASGTCIFWVNDTNSGVPTNTVTVTVM
jgi:hypothetical protein